MQTGKVYSLDLRERVIAGYQKGKATMKEVAHSFAVSRSWINVIVLLNVEQKRLVKDLQSTIS
jgi:transposase-like protein